MHTTEIVDSLDIYYDTVSGNDDISQYRYYKKIHNGHILPLKEQKRQIFSFFLDHLEEDTKYYFIIGNAKIGYSKEKCFKTLSRNKTCYRFIEGGDWEITKEAEKLAKIAASYNPEAIWLGGDYPRNISSLNEYAQWDMWLDIYEKHMITKDNCLIPLILAIGNHEVVGGYNQTKKNSPFFFSYFPQNPNDISYFSKKFGEKVVLFVLDSGHISPHNGTQKIWLEENLKKHKDCTIKMAMYHVPLYPSVRFIKKTKFYYFCHWLLTLSNTKNPAARLFSLQSQQGRKSWLPLFDAFHLTAAFEHHDQTLKRTKPLKNNQIHNQGTVYFGDGGWGASFHVPPIQSYFSPIFAKTLGYISFFWMIDINEDTITYRAINTKGQTLDKYHQIIQQKGKENGKD